MILTLALAMALIFFVAFASSATAQTGDMDRAFGITLGQPLPLSGKQVQAVGSPGFGLARYMLLFTPGSLPPYARYFATVDSNTKRVVGMTGITRNLGSVQDAWDVFDREIKRLETAHGSGMRLGGGAIWKVKRQGRSITLMLNPQARKVSIRFADDRRMDRLLPVQ